MPWRDPPEGSTATAAAVAARHKGAAPATRKRTGSCCRIAGRPTRERARTHRAKLGHADVRATAWRYKLPCIRCQKASAWEKGLPWPELDRPATATTVPAGHKLLALPELHRGAPPGEKKGGTGRNQPAPLRANKKRKGRQRRIVTLNHRHACSSRSWGNALRPRAPGRAPEPEPNIRLGNRVRRRVRLRHGVALLRADAHPRLRPRTRLLAPSPQSGRVSSCEADMPRPRIRTLLRSQGYDSGVGNNMGDEELYPYNVIRPRRTGLYIM